MKFIRTDSELQTPIVDSRIREEGHELVLLSTAIDENEFCREIQNCDILLVCYAPVSQKVINSATRLKAIIKCGVDIDSIDIPAANEKGIVVANIPEYAEETVAEGAFAFMMALAKKLPAIQEQMKINSWIWPEQKWLANDLAGKKLGIIGCGKIGTSMARMAIHGFRMKVLAFDPGADKAELAEMGIMKIDDLKEMLSQCDFVSLHAVLNEQTRLLIGEDELAVMKSSAIIINTARGALIDEQALLSALKAKKIVAAGLDVFSCEPLNKENHDLKELYAMDNVLLIPHLAYYTKEAMQRLEREVLQRCYEVVENRPVLIKSNDPRLQNQSSLNTRYLQG